MYNPHSLGLVLIYSFGLVLIRSFGFVLVCSFRFVLSLVLVAVKTASLIIARVFTFKSAAKVFESCLGTTDKRKLKNFQFPFPCAIFRSKEIKQL